jgi:hypothetical protein
MAKRSLFGLLVLMLVCAPLLCALAAQSNPG